MIHAKRWNLTTTATCSLAMTFSLTPHWWSTWWVSDLTVQNFTEENHHQYQQYEVAKNQSEILSLLKISVKWRGWIFFVHIVEHTVFQIFGKQQFCRQTKVNSCFSCSFSLSAKFASIFFSFFFLIDQQFHFIAKYSFEEFSSQRSTEVRQWTPSPFQLKGKSPAVWIHNSIV